MYIPRKPDAHTPRTVQSMSSRWGVLYGVPGAHGVPMDSPWGVRGHPWGVSYGPFTDCLRTVHDQPHRLSGRRRTTRERPANTPRTVHAHPMTEVGCPRGVHGQSMGFLSTVRGAPVGVRGVYPTDYPWAIHELPTDFPQTAHGLPTGCPQTLHGRPMDRSMGSPWIVRGRGVGSPWGVDGHPMHCPWAPYRLLMETAPWVRHVIRQTRTVRSTDYVWDISWTSEVYLLFLQIINNHIC